MSTENWPLSPSGVPERAALLDWDADLPAFSGIALSKLEAFGIPFTPPDPDWARCRFSILEPLSPGCRFCP